MPSESSRPSLPFERSKNRKKAPKTNSGSSSPATPPSTSVQSASKPKTQTKQKEKKTEQKRRYTREEMAIPEVVSQRMLSRMVVLAGFPLLMGLGTFIGSYFIVTRELFILPNTAVLLVSMGCFGLSVIGLSYGVLSASWDEENQGSILGWGEFKLNLGRMIEGWKSARKKPE